MAWFPSLTPSGRPRHSLTSDLAASGALALYSLAVAAGFARVFAGWGFFDNLAILVVLGHGLGLVFRRLTLPGWFAVPLTFVVLVWAIGALHYRFTYSNLLPTTETIDLFRSELDLVRGQFRTAVAPVLYGAGWDVLASIGLATAVLLSDTFAFRAAARAEALVPGGVLYVFVAAVGADRGRVGLTVLLVAAGALAVIVLRNYHASAAPRAPRQARPRSLLAPAGVLAAVVIALVAGFVGPRLPGADADALYETTGRGGGGVTTVQNPLVDIRSRLTNQGNEELFVMTADRGSYWRSLALPNFDGVQWDLPDEAVRPPSEQLSAGRSDDARIDQTLRISALRGKLVPAAPDVTQITGAGEIRVSDDASTVLVTGDDLRSGDTFRIDSSAPRFSLQELSSATSVSPPDPIYLSLPQNFPRSVRRLAEDVTAGSRSSYEAALMLQNWFQDEFTYSLEAQSGHSDDAMRAFLRERVGYCEQFAGTYAAMLRSIGIPTRVAVGYTPGNDIGGNSFSVLGKNAHAWPEVWFDGLGWVLFEPTPGRGAPGASSWTGLPPRQDDSGVTAGEAEAREAVETTPEPQAPVPTGVAAEDPAEALPDGGLEVPLNAEDGETDTSSGTATWWWVLIVVVILATLAPWVVRRMRRRSSGPPERELARLWERSLTAVEQVGVHPEPAATPLETARQASEQFPLAARPLGELAEVVTRTTYGSGGGDQLTEVGSLGNSRLRSCAHWTRQIERAANDSMGLPARVRRHFTTWS